MGSRKSISRNISIRSLNSPSAGKLFCPEPGSADEPVGFVFALPDLMQKRRGETLDTVIVKTVAVLPGRRQAGLGSVLVALAHDGARRLGYRRSIHALMHESNQSLNLSAHYARPFRRYTLFAKELTR